MNKECAECHEVKSLDEFHKKKNAPDGRYKECKVCRRPKVRAITLFRAYGITVAEYDAMLELQGGCCGICRSPKPYSMGAFMVDHDHRCCPGAKGCRKCVRGLLCRTCNENVGWWEKYGHNLVPHLSGFVARRILMEIS